MVCKLYLFQIWNNGTKQSSLKKCTYQKRKNCAIQLVLSSGFDCMEMEQDYLWVWENAFCFDFQKLNTRWFGRWPSCQRHMQYHNWCSANHLYMHRSVWPAFGEVLVFRTVEFSPLSLSALSHSLSIWSMSCMPLFRPRTKATELAITIAKWTTGTGIHLHDDVVSHLRLHLAGKNLALLVMMLVICIYILFAFTCYICLVAMQAGPKASGRNLRYEHVFLQDCKRESAYRRSANAAKQTHTHTHRHTQCRDNIYIYIS